MSDILSSQSDTVRFVNGEELQRRLDGRSLAWLARELDVSRTAIWRWVNDVEPIPGERAEAIRRRLPLPNEEVQGDGRE